MTMTAAQALAFIEARGLVLQSGRHATIESLASAVAGERIAGSWWGHAKGRAIFGVLSTVDASPDIVATRLIGGKVTLIHRRLWAALATLADAGELDAAGLAKVTQEHTASGHHETREVPYPRWLPPDLERLTVPEALSRLGESLVASLPRPGGAAPRSRASAGRGARGRRR